MNLSTFLEGSLFNSFSFSLYFLNTFFEGLSFLSLISSLKKSCLNKDSTKSYLSNANSMTFKINVEIKTLSKESYSQRHDGLDNCKLKAFGLLSQCPPKNNRFFNSHNFSGSFHCAFEFRKTIYEVCCLKSLKKVCNVERLT